MFAVCDATLPLSEAMFFRGSYVESVLKFRSHFPTVSAVVVYRDIRGRCRTEDFQFVASLSSRQLDSICSKYISSC